MDTAQWPQEIAVKPITEEINVTCVKPDNNNLERKIRTKKEDQALKCPRCNSTNTKFCYYNNYSLTQPRYFCKTCRRYWTEGGSLRNIPVGGGSRKNKRSSSSSSYINSSNPISNSNKLPNLITPHDPSSTSNSTLNPILENPNHSLNLAFPSTNPCIRGFSDLVRIPSSSVSVLGTSVDGDGAGAGGCSLSFSALELLNGISSTTRGLKSNFMQTGDPNSVYNTTTGGFDSVIGDFKPISLNFSLDGMNNGSGYDAENTSGRLLVPFEDLKQVSTNNNSNGENDIVNDHGQKGDSTGYWSGMLGGNGSW